MSRRSPSQRGVTLFEVLIVVSLIGVLAGAVLYGSGMVGGSRMRAAGMLIITGVRIGITRANATGMPVRLVMDLDNDRVILEESATRRMLRVKDEEENTGGGAEAATEAEKQARTEAERILEGPRAPRAQFKPVAQFGFDADDPSQGRKLGPGVRFRQVQTQHDGQPRSEGRAYLYFWPGGGTEHAAIQIARDGDDEGITVMVSALTGRAQIERGKVELPEPRSDGDYSEREDDL